MVPAGATKLKVGLVPVAIYAPIFVALERIPRALFEASADLGAPAWTTFRQVTWPLSRRGVLIGASLTFVLALGDPGVPKRRAGARGGLPGAPSLPDGLPGQLRPQRAVGRAL